MDPLDRLYADVDEGAGRLHAQHAASLACARGCADCCVDGITVFEVEAARIRAQHGALLAAGEPHPEGACAFLDGERACRIYADRPYVCRTQGLPLRWLDELEGQTVEYRDVCPLNEAVGLEGLPATACWSLGPVEARLQALQRGASGDLRRVPLRALFAGADGSE
ncbi:MAG: YkgJ family cysteine cluster protein [Planctomycetes bacterium]|nr:YkgJ family cysteine cluster protein [Planctomycetota bacterium]